MNRPTLTVAGQVSEVVASDGSVVLNIPITLRQRSGRRVVAVGGFGCESGERNRTGATPLQLALARGQRWLRMLEAGEVSSLREIAKRDGADHSYVAKHLNLTLPAPDIVAAILDDALLDGIRLSALLCCAMFTRQTQTANGVFPLRLGKGGARMSPTLKFARLGCTAICVYALGACSLRGIRVEDLPEPTIRSSWAQAGIRDERAAFTGRFCQELSEVSPGEDCTRWLWKPPKEAPSATIPAVGTAPQRTLVIAPGIFGECVAPWVTPFSADYTALEGRGYRIKVLPLEGNASAARNAMIIHEHLSDPRLALTDALVIAYSKGASDFMLAASQPESAGWRHRISAFVSVAGTPHGSPAANHGADLYQNLLAKFPLHACGSSDGGSVQSLTYAETRRTAEAFVESKPPFATYSIVAVAAGEPINPLLDGFHRWLSRIDERNDGQVLLEDAVVSQSTVLGVFRADHWSIALPFEESTALQMKPLGYNNHFPRGALVRAIVEFTAPVSTQATTQQEP